MNTNLEEDLYLLKFPMKLWCIVNECKSGAISWGPNGRTILINYDRFQTEYLECPTPKFKTRNMTSFVRQMNMYGFKKTQGQHSNFFTRHMNVHEFQNDNFVYGRPDMLTNVRRRIPSLKAPRDGCNNHYRVNDAREAFDRALTESPELHIFWDLFSLKVLIPGYKCRLIPVFNRDVDSSRATFEVESKYNDQINFNPLDDNVDESENESMSESLIDDEDEDAGEVKIITEDAYCTMGYNTRNFIIKMKKKTEQQEPIKKEENAVTQEPEESQDCLDFYDALAQSLMTI